MVKSQYMAMIVVSLVLQNINKNCSKYFPFLYLSQQIGHVPRTNVEFKRCQKFAML